MQQRRGYRIQSGPILWWVRACVSGLPSLQQSWGMWCAYTPLVPLPHPRTKTNNRHQTCAKSNMKPALCRRRACVLDVCGYSHPSSRRTSTLLTEVRLTLLLAAIFTSCKPFDSQLALTAQLSLATTPVQHRPARCSSQSVQLLRLQRLQGALLLRRRSLR